MVTGMDEAARAAIVDAGLVVGTVSTEASPTVPRAGDPQRPARRCAGRRGRRSNSRSAAGQTRHGAERGGPHRGPRDRTLEAQGSTPPTSRPRRPTLSRTRATSSGSPRRGQPGRAGPDPPADLDRHDRGARRRRPNRGRGPRRARRGRLQRGADRTSSVERDDAPAGDGRRHRPRAGSAVGAGEGIALLVAVPTPPEPTPTSTALDAGDADRGDDVHLAGRPPRTGGSLPDPGRGPRGSGWVVQTGGTGQAAGGCRRRLDGGRVGPGHTSSARSPACGARPR